MSPRLLKALFRIEGSEFVELGLDTATVPQPPWSAGVSCALRLCVHALRDESSESRSKSFVS